MRFYKTAGAIGLAAVFSLAMLVFLAASFFPAQVGAACRGGQCMGRGRFVGALRRVRPGSARRMRRRRAAGL